MPITVSIIVQPSRFKEGGVDRITLLPLITSAWEATAQSHYVQNQPCRFTCLLWQFPNRERCRARVLQLISCRGGGLLVFLLLFAVRIQEQLYIVGGVLQCIGLQGVGNNGRSGTAPLSFHTFRIRKAKIDYFKSRHVVDLSKKIGFKWRQMKTKNFEFFW